MPTRRLEGSLPDATSARCEELLQIHRSESALHPQQRRTQLFPQSESLHPEFLCIIWGDVLRHLADGKINSRIALDRRPETFRGYPEPIGRAWLWVCCDRDSKSTMGSIHGTCRGQLDSEAQF